MRVYFVRHGESRGNTGPGKGNRDALTAKGWRQADQLGRRLADIPFSKVYVSPMQRAQETASAILEHIDATLIHNNDIHEFIWLGRTPKQLDPVTAHRTFVAHWEKMAGIPTDQSPAEGTESFQEIHDRTTRFLRKLELDKDGKPILVVTHGGFLRFVMGLSILRDRFSPADLRDWMRTLTLNTGITEFECVSNTRGDYMGGWRLVTWMDQAHL